MAVVVLYEMEAAQLDAMGVEWLYGTDGVQLQEVRAVQLNGWCRVVQHVHMFLSYNVC